MNHHPNIPCEPTDEMLADAAAFDKSRADRVTALLGIFVGLLIAKMIFDSRYVITPFGDVVPRSAVHTIPVTP